MPVSSIILSLYENICRKYFCVCRRTKSFIFRTKILVCQKRINFSPRLSIPDFVLEKINFFSKPATKPSMKPGFEASYMCISVLVKYNFVSFSLSTTVTSVNRSQL